MVEGGTSLRIEDGVWFDDFIMVVDALSIAESGLVDGGCGMETCPMV